MSKQARKQERDMMDQVLETFMNQGVQSMTHEKKSDYLSAVMLVAYQMMRKVDGDDFVRGFFESALADMAVNESPVEFKLPN